MLAVIENIEQVCWESFSEKYRNSPFLKLDSNILKENENEIPAENMHNGHSDTTNTQFEELKKKVYMKRSKAFSWRELLNQIKNISYIVYDNEALDHLHNELSKLLETLRHHAPKDKELVLEKPHTVRNIAQMKTCSSLPKPKQRKSSLTGRVGIAAEQKRKATTVSVMVPKMKKVAESTVEEFPEFDANDCYDIPLNTTEDDPNAADNNDEEAVVHSQTIQKHSEKTADDSLCEEEEVVIIKVKPAGGKIVTQRKLIFNKEERDTIMNKHMLSDEAINLAQNLLKAQFPEITGFQDTVVGKTQSYDIIRKEENFIQLLHAGSLHWVCVANTASNKHDNGECQLFDSLSNGTVSPDVAQQIAAFLMCDLPEILVEIKPVQQQTNSVDCGLFAIAFAASLAFGEDPTTVVYDTERLRPHLVKCLDNNAMKTFPKLYGKRMLRYQLKLSTIELYCICRMPYNEKSNRYEDQMVECFQCLSWFHVSCENIPSKIFDSKHKSEVTSHVKNVRKADLETISFLFILNISAKLEHVQFRQFLTKDD